ncbi:MAG TPA: ATP-dependent dethiobiotin synthetase BioD [Candidatus Merdimorpha stercoravium]|uniref:ATP-dependent dethiobiotin synthetase BioD n=1 Tax=Candidatus Merdimorpha stercoravium TaxID=2840863 RepID=A0A9D1KT14_9FLAO|nr:ATP-dependent dethiobiotin synthetase BioD [Candidatus Merdimorpha stercoravium]
MEHKKTYFITGIDTDAGKTWVTGAFARYLVDRGQSVVTQKIAQTGCVDASEDIERHRLMMGTGALPEDAQGLTCPFIFTVPCSPHLAAEIDGGRIDPEKITAARKELEKRYEYVLCEGVGGLCVPLTREEYLIDWLARQDLPVVLVTSGKLGSINHTVMSLEVCRSRGIDIAAVVYNYYPDVLPQIEADTVRVIRDYLDKTYPRCAFIRVGNLAQEGYGSADFSALL